MQRSWLDYALLATLLPIWLVCFALHVREVVRTGYALPPVFVTRSWSSIGYPRVGGLRMETYQADSGLEVGDWLLRVGETDLHGVGHSEFSAVVFDQVGPDLRVPVDFERAGESRRIELALTPSPLPWFRIPGLVAIAVTAVLVLLRSPPGQQGRLFFLAFMSFLILQTPFDGSSYAQTLVSQSVFAGMGGLAVALMLLWAFRFPGEASGPGRIGAGWAWLAAPFWYAGRLNFALGGPVAPALGPALTLAQEFLLAFAFLGGLTWNYRRADLIGRRRVKWVVFGAYLGSMSWAVMMIAGRLLPESRWLGELGLVGALGVATFPVCVMIAVLRFQLFDIDRLISMAASYNLVVIVLVALALGIVPHVAQAASAALEINPTTGQMVMSVALAFVVVPAHRRMHGLIDRLFFSDRHQLEQGIAPLIAELSASQVPHDLIVLAGERLWLLLRPQSCVVYARGADGFAPILVKGRSIPPSIPSAAPLIGALMRAPEPVALDHFAGGHGVRTADPSDDLLLQMLRVPLVVPIRRGDELVAFVCLAAKRSGDVYTATDLAFLAAVADKVSTKLRGFEEAHLLEEARAMHGALRRYVPSALAEQLEKGQELVSGEQEVSVLFVDIRGYTSYSEGRGAVEIFSLVDRFTDTLCKIVGTHGGCVVEFLGDGVLALFGAPNMLPDKERAAVRVGREMILAVAALSFSLEQGERPVRVAVSVGVATGIDFVGNIRAADRVIWSVVGNTTNLAARLESVSRQLDASMVVDAPTWQAAKEACAGFIPRRGVAIRGRQNREDVYALPLTAVL